MNLRKDHCRNLYSRTTCELVLNTWGRRSLVVRLPSVTRRVQALRRLPNPGAESAKEYYNRQPSPRALFTDHGGMRASLITQTILDNKYLGSRIDEEGSEMRCLV